MSEVYTKPVHGSCLDKQQEVGCSQLEVPTFSENDVESLILSIAQNESEILRLIALTGLRQLLSNRTAPFQKIIDYNGVAIIIHIINQTSDEALLYEAIWCLTNIACGEQGHCHSISANNGITCLTSVLGRSQSTKIHHQVMWTLGNLAACCEEVRDQILASDARYYLSLYLNPGNEPDMLQVSSWTIANLASITPIPHYDDLKIFVEPLAYHLRCSDNENLLVQVCACFEQLVCSRCSGPVQTASFPQDEDCKIEDLINAGIVPKLVQLLSHSNEKIRWSSLQIVGEMMSGSLQSALFFVSSGILLELRKFLQSSDPVMQATACCIIGNLLSLNSEALRHKLFQDSVVDQLLRTFSSASMALRIHVAHVLSDICGADLQPKEVDTLVESKILESINVLLSNDEISQENTLVLLELLSGILNHASRFEEKSAKTVENLFNCGCVDTLEELQMSSSELIYKKSMTLIQNFLPQEMDLGQLLVSEGVQRD